MLAQAHHLCRNDLSLQRRSELLCLGEPQTKLGQAGRLVALDPGYLGLRRHTKLPFCDQLHPPHQLCHQLTLVP